MKWLAVPGSTSRPAGGSLSASIQVGLALAAGACIAAAITGCAVFKKNGSDAPAPGTPSPPSSPPSSQGGAGSGKNPSSAVNVPQTGRGQGTASAPIRLAPPERPRDWAHARRQAAQRMIAADPAGTYVGKPPPILLAIPVLTIELNGDGSVRHISVMRYPSQARDTVNTAMAAVRKAAPFGDVSHLPKPWKFNETFLFNDERRFKPMTLDRP